MGCNSAWRICFVGDELREYLDILDTLEEDADAVLKLSWSSVEIVRFGRGVKSEDSCSSRLSSRRRLAGELAMGADLEADVETEGVGK